LSKEDVVKRLKANGVSEQPLEWGPEAEIEGKQDILDFDPVVLECTEVYLDNRSFFEHAASREWMNASPEILKPNRSLRPKTYCVGNPSQDIWDKTLEASLKAIRFGNQEDSELVRISRPGLFISSSMNDEKSANANDKSIAYFLELDLLIKKDKLENCRAYIDKIREIIEPQFMIIFPKNLDPESDPSGIESVDLRVMTSFEFKNSKQISSLFSDLKNNFCEQFQGKLLYSVDKTHALEMLHQFGLSVDDIVIQDTKEESEALRFAGYILHPLFKNLKPDVNFQYQM
jgi:hypothetical protein